MAKGKGFASSPLQLMTIFSWLQHDWLKGMLVNVAKTATCLEITALKLAIEQLQRDLALLTTV